MEAQGKALIQQRAELEAAAQARQQELGALQLEVAKLRKDLREWDLEREFVELEEPFSSRSGITSSTLAETMVRKKIFFASCKP